MLQSLWRKKDNHKTSDSPLSIIGLSPETVIKKGETAVKAVECTAKGGRL